MEARSESALNYGIVSVKGRGRGGGVGGPLVHFLLISGNKSALV